MGDLLTFARRKPAVLGTYRHLSTLFEHGWLRLILARVEGVEQAELRLLLDGLDETGPVALLGLPEDHEGARDILEVAAAGAFATLLATTEWNDPMGQAS